MAGRVKPGSRRMFRGRCSVDPIAKFERKKSCGGSYSRTDNWTDINCFEFNIDSHFEVLQEIELCYHGREDVCYRKDSSPEQLRAWICVSYTRGKFIISHSELIRISKPGESIQKVLNKRKLAEAKKAVASAIKSVEKRRLDLSNWEDELEDRRKILEKLEKELEKA